MNEQQQADRLLYLFRMNDKSYFVEAISEELKVSVYLAGCIYEAIYKTNYEGRLKNDQ